MVRLLNRRPTNVRRLGQKISLDFDGEHLENRIVYRRIPEVANWDRHRDVVIVPRSVPRKLQVSLAVHESVEKYITEKYGYGYRYAHMVSEHIEERWAREHGIDIPSYQRTVVRLSRAYKR